MSVDPGLQPERTRLAWRRTALASTVVTVLTIRLALGGGRTGALLVALTLLTWTAILALGWRRGTRGGRLATDGVGVRLVALATVGHALLGVLLVLHARW